VLSLKSHKNFGWKTLRNENTWKTDMDEKILVKWVLKTLDVYVWTIFNWIRTGFSGSLVQIRLHKRHAIS
jgi:hypothetical protein